jgi:hypothetical protein
MEGTGDMLQSIETALGAGRLIPYLGAGVLGLVEGGSAVPASPAELVTHLTASVSVPHKIRNNLTAAAQFIENFKHRKTVRHFMQQAFAPRVEPTGLHRYLASLAPLPLVVHAWYDDLPQQALALRGDWGMIQGVSQAEHFGQWTHAFRPDGTKVADPGETSAWSTVLYQPFGSVAPAGNFLVSDSDFVEVLTEIDIQTPIPPEVQEIRSGRGFLFLGCRFSTQLERIFAHQIMKRSGGQSWAVLPETPTRNELRFLQQHGIERLEMTLADFADTLIGQPVPAGA